MHYVDNATPSTVCGVCDVLCLYKSLRLTHSDNHDYLVRVVVVAIEVACLGVGHGQSCEWVDAHPVGWEGGWVTERGSS